MKKKRLPLILSLMGVICLAITLFLSACAQPKSSDGGGGGDGGGAGGSSGVDSTPPQNTSVNIDNGALFVYSDEVTLSLGAKELVADDTGVAAFYVKDNSSEMIPATPTAVTLGWVSVTPTVIYNANINYNLLGSYSGGGGIYVYVWFKDGAGNITAAVTDSVMADILSAPLNVIALPRDQGGFIAWDEIADAAYYNVYWSTTTGVTNDTGNQVSVMSSPFNHDNLTNGTNYYYVITTMSDFGESAASGEVTTIPLVDLTPPSISGHSPEPEDFLIPADSNIYFELDDTEHGIALNSINVTVAGSSVIAGGVLMGGYSGQIAYDGDGGYDVTLNPYGIFSSDQLVDVMVNAADAAANPLAASPYSFTCGPPPTVSGRSPAPNDTGINFDTDIIFNITDEGSGVDLSTLNLNINADSALVNGAINGNYSGSINSDGSGGYLVTIDPDVNFSLDQNVNLVIKAADLAGNSMSPVTYSFNCLSGAWKPTDSLNSARTDHTATTLINGRVLVAGGYNSGYNSSCELFNPDNNTWSATGSLTDTRDDHTATLLGDGKVLVAGGYGASTDCELYDPDTASWSLTDALIVSRGDFSATLLGNGQVLIAGGYNGSHLENCELFNPYSEIWSATGSLYNGRHYHTSTLLTNGKVLVAGGHGVASGSELYNPASGAWSITSNLNYGRDDHTATMLTNGKVLVVGGYYSGYTSSCELYDSATGTWSVTGSLIQARDNHTATLLANGQVLIAGGYSYGYLANCELYDPVTGSWSLTGNLNQVRSNHTATKLGDGRVLIAGGRSSSAYLSSCEVYEYALPADSYAPEVSNRIPDDGDSGVAVDTDIYFVISDPLPPDGSFLGVDRNSLSVTVAGGNAVINGEIQPGFSGGIAADEIGGFYVTLDPDSGFSPGQTVNITIDADDLAAVPNSLPPMSYSFTCN